MNTLLTTALLASATLAAAAARDDCASQAIAMKSWTIHNFNFNASKVFTTPAHQFGDGYVGFNLFNTVTNEERRCDGGAGRLDPWFVGDANFQCRTMNGANDPNTVFNFNLASRTVKLNQSFECPGSVTQYVAQGGADLSKHVGYTKTEYHNYGWTYPPGGNIYEAYSEKIEPFDAELTVDSIRVNA
ncbi:hypothetical protein VHEMI04347 [[Torrubiella] hemipterigena]|uniref:AA1-like domain-containing protein n=1 Tax=[Torrubiella] hemipterigena TaxID=1531966 RepID=A0A0A1TG16_9HYPO|nr:hypothetical protein VHEMI04347 [[Torrubiella] hemipterigena]